MSRTIERPDRPDFSVGIPIYNEEQTIEELGRRLLEVMESVRLRGEVILVNDGSSDGSLDRLRDLAASDDRFKVIDLSRNFGHQAALYSALCRASGDAVVLMDGDLQDPPELIPKLLDEWKRGFQVVYAVRKSRKERLLKRAAYALYYRILKTLAYVPIPVDSGDFALMDRRVVDLVRGMPERNKFLRGLRAWAGFSQTSVDYERDARFAGEEKYTLGKLMRLGLDGLIAYSFIPLRLAYVLGAVVSIGSFGLAGVYFYQRIFSDQFIPQGFTTLAILILFLGGVQLLTIGVLGEYLGRIYEEVKRRPEFVERELIGFEPE
jgi:glycosyltransferase involved in cell wall biosynthesis